MPEIWYDLCAQKKRYYPDIYIPSHNMLIEVKSPYTLKANLEKNIAKREASLALGYDYHIFVYKKRSFGSPYSTYSHI